MKAVSYVGITVHLEITYNFLIIYDGSVSESLLHRVGKNIYISKLVTRFNRLISVDEHNNKKNKDRLIA